MNNNNKEKKHRQAILALMDKDKQDLLKSGLGEEFYPRIYHVPQTHYDPAINACTTAHLAYSHNPEEQAQREHYRRIHETLKCYMHPHYFLDKDLMALLNMTDFASNFDLSNLNMAHEACTFTLPLWSLRDTTPIPVNVADKKARRLIAAIVGYISQVSYARAFDLQTPTQRAESLKQAEANSSYDRVPTEHQGTDIRTFDASFSKLWAATLGLKSKLEQEVVQKNLLEDAGKKYREPVRVIQNFQISITHVSKQCCTCSYPILPGQSNLGEILRIYGQRYSLDSKLVGLDENDKLVPVADLTTDNVTYDYDDPYAMGFDFKNSTNDQAKQGSSFLDYMCKFVFSLIMYMSVRKSEYIPKPTVRKKGAVRIGKETKDLWSPNFLGSKYKGYIGKTESNKGYKLKPHWRSGYMGIRWTGNGPHKLPRNTWVLPYPVNVDKEKKAA